MCHTLWSCLFNFFPPTQLSQYNPNLYTFNNDNIAKCFWIKLPPKSLSLVPHFQNHISQRQKNMKNFQLNE